VTFVVLVYLIYSPTAIPDLSTAGFLGAVNITIISFLLLLCVRQFLYLFFSVCEEVPREQIPDDIVTYPISIIVPAYNEGVVIKDTIRTLLQINYPVFEVIVVDDGSSDNTFDLAKEIIDPPDERGMGKRSGGMALVYLPGGQGPRGLSGTSSRSGRVPQAGGDPGPGAG
jgi:hypothetical protein